MSVYIFSQYMEYVLKSLDYMQTHKGQMSKETFASIKCVWMNIIGQKEINNYNKMGGDKEQLMSMYQYLADNHSVLLSMKTKDKLEELKEALHYTDVNYRNKEIWLIKKGYVIAAILLNEENKETFWAIRYFQFAKLVRMEIYTDRVIYANSYVTSKSENGLYAKLVKRTFYNHDGNVAYDQIFEGNKEWFLFPNGECYTKPQVTVEFIKRLNLSDKDTVLLDASVPNELVWSVFAFGKTAHIIILNHIGHDLGKGEGVEGGFLKGYYYDWFPYSESIDTMVVSTEEQKRGLMEELKKYCCSVPDIEVMPIDGEFTSTELVKSSDDVLVALWKFNGKADGFCVCDELGACVGITRNRNQRQLEINNYGDKNNFTLRAYVDTLKGKVTIAESRLKG